MSAPVLDKNESLAQRLAKVAAAFPERNALFVNGRYYSYRELMQLADEIRSGISDGRTYPQIGIYCTNDVYTYASIIAVNLYGAAYVPLNSKFPPARNKKILGQCDLNLILSGVENDDLKEISGATKVIYIHTLPHKNAATNSVNAEQELCYILFTSGSTGESKGVPVSNENVRHFFNYFLQEYDFGENDKFLQIYDLTFDVSVFSFFMPLLVGACCYVLPDDGIKALKIPEALNKYNISVVSMVPGVLRYLEKYLFEIELPALRYSFFSGDSLLHALAVKWQTAAPNAALHNFYGPTETTIVCTRYIFDEKNSSAESVNGIVPLGKPFPGMDFLLLDEENNPAEKGELCFSGTQVIAEYLDKNESRFFNYRNRRYYKTGDLASLNKNGNLIFYGRNDSQVKINGYRIELAEVEHAVMEITHKSCIVFHKENELFAFVEIKEINGQKLRDELYKTLPEYMVPKRFIALETFSLNANGKVDRKALINSYL